MPSDVLRTRSAAGSLALSQKSPQILLSNIFILFYPEQGILDRDAFFSQMVK